MTLHGFLKETQETHTELFYLWNSLGHTRWIKFILGKMILISVLLGRKKYF